MEKYYEFLNHACIRFDFDGVVVYTDPFELNESRNDADIILITHNHFDHYSVPDLEKVIKDNTKVVVPEKVNAEEVLKMRKNVTILKVLPSDLYNVKDIKFETVPAYNVNKQFHRKEEGWVGYIIEFNQIKFYVAGDTDITEENRKVKCDVAFVPVGGKYTMNCEEAAQLVNEIKPKIAVPIHYGKVVGSIEDADKFMKLINTK